MRKINHVIFVMKADLQGIPPAVTHIRILRKLGYRVTVIHSPTSRNIVEVLRSINVEHIEVGRPSEVGLVEKLQTWRGFRSGVGRVLRQVETSRSLLWAATGDTALCIYDLLLGRKGQYVLALMELYEAVPAYNAALAPLARSAAAVITCERNRGEIMVSRWSLKVKPIVVPNKPYGLEIPRRCFPSCDESANAIHRIADKKVVLYQGIITPERDLAGICKAIEALDGRMVLAIMGTDSFSMLDSLRGLHPGLIHLDYVPSPKHLEVTSYAYIGIATYTGDTLNSWFCAPNKIFEYASFGVPTLANRIPGLELTVGINGAGVCVDTNDPFAVAEGLLMIDDSYEQYSASSKRFFDSVDLEALINSVLDSVEMI